MSACGSPCRCRWTSVGCSIAGRDAGSGGAARTSIGGGDLGAGGVQLPAAPPPCLGAQEGDSSAACDGRYHEEEHIAGLGDTPVSVPHDKDHDHRCQSRDR
jgi:hypothetical protein